jgi:hypothetical protein
MPSPKPAPDLGQLIFVLRDQRVILDSDLAALYHVPTKALNQAVKRNADRFTVEFAFPLTRKELAILKSQFVTSSFHGGRRTLPYAFTEHGVLMASNVLKSPRAIAVSVALIKAFVRLRELITSSQGVTKRLTEAEKTLLLHDTALRDIYQRIQPLLQPPPDPPRKKIGF